MQALLAQYEQVHFLAASTATQYRLAVDRWVAHFGERTLDSISSRDLAGFTASLLKAGNREATANKIRRHLLSILRFAVEIGALDKLPSWRPLREPKRAPVAFTAAEFQQGLKVAREWPGWVCGVPAGVWWESLLLSIWYSGARIGAMVEVRWEDVLIERSGLYVRAEYQKQLADQFFVVGQDCVDALVRARQPERDLVWPWPRRRENLYYWFRRIFSHAGVSLGTKTGSLFHRIRKSTASYIRANGGDATSQLGHSCASVTARYFDPRIVGAHDSTVHMPSLSME